MLLIIASFALFGAIAFGAVLTPGRGFWNGLSLLDGFIFGLAGFTTGFVSGACSFK